MALATDTEGVFKCGISVAPVTDWTLYGKIISFERIRKRMITISLLRFDLYGTIYGFTDRPR